MSTATQGAQYGIATQTQRGVTSGADMMGFLFGSGNPAQNYLINGDMSISQRGTTISVASGGSGGAYTADRWTVGDFWTGGPITATIDSDVPTGTNFTGSLKLVATGALAFGTSGMQARIRQRIEGYNAVEMYSGNITLSFWVKSSIIGNMTVVFANANSSRAYSTLVAISQANVWEKKTLTVNLAQGVSSGVWEKTTGIGLSVAIAFNSGAKTGTADTWEDSPAVTVLPGTMSWGSINDTILFTGFMLNLGSTAQPFSRAGGTIGGELALCQRYCYAMKSDTNANRVFGHGDWAMGSLNCYPYLQFPVQMRASPTLTGVSAANTFGITAAGAGVVLNAAPAINQATSQSALMTLVVASGGGTPGTIGRFYANGTTGASLVFDAEL